MSRQTSDTGSYTRTILPRDPGWPPTPAQTWPPFGGDELRAREWLWRTLGVGIAAMGRHQ